MVYMQIAGLIVVSFILVYKVNDMIARIKEIDSRSVGALAKIFLGWPIAVTVGAVETMLFYACNVPGYFIQLLDLLLTLLIIVVIDIKLRIIPNGITVGLAVSQLVIVICLSQSRIDIWNILISGAVLLVLLLISKVSKGQVGMGDVKLITAVNLIYGLSFTAYSLILSLLVMIIFSIPLLISGKLKLKSQLPFAPFYFLGTVTYIIFNLI